MQAFHYNGTLVPLEVSGEVTWKSPSNIALTKYWGKYANQLPRNPSISFTLNAAHTVTKVAFMPQKNLGEISLDFYFEGHQMPKFKDRIMGFFRKNKEHLPYIEDYHWTIHSHNSFPHSSGIASSASAMSALMACLCDIEQTYFEAEYNLENHWKRVSFLSRLASGSACRSAFPALSLWGHLEDIPESSNHYAMPMASCLHPVFNDFHDDIIIISSEEKTVSSSAGHAIMDSNPYAQVRFDTAKKNTLSIIDTIKNGDLEHFVSIVESEALTLHALMMTGHPSYLLMKPMTLQVIQRIRQFRKETQVPLCFTLDAGPNVHILYPDSVHKVCTSFIEDELLPLTDEGRRITDHLGSGPEKI